MLETRIPIKDTDKELVIINFHLEAYDSGEGKIAQSKKLAKKLQEEYEKGNYVIAGGDFNQTFEGMDTYPITNKENWVPGIMRQEDLPEHLPSPMPIMHQPVVYLMKSIKKIHKSMSLMDSLHPII
mgnify:CR=1 FL=1